MRLSLRTQQTALNGTTAACLLTVPVIMVWGLVAPASFVSGSATSGSSEASPAEDKSLIARASVQNLQEDGALWTKRLRRPLYDPPPPVVQKKELPPLRVALLGTIIESDNSMAIVSSPDGNVEYKRVGDHVGPADSSAAVVEILSDSIVVERDDAKITVRQDKKDQ